MNSLIVFEAAARHLSFTKAADGIKCHNQGAISRQIRPVGRYLGQQYYQTFIVHFEVSQATAEIKKWQDDCDLALFYSKAPPANMKSHHIPEEVFHKSLLSLDESQKDWINWAEWFALVGYPMFKPKNRVNINNYPLLIQAAINGQGVALAWGSLVDDYLRNGVLIRPVETILRTQTNFCMLEPIDRGVIPSSVKQFRNWLLEQLPGQVGQKGLNEPALD
ncbi:hypothetical protein FQR65_LT19396 [Abscondita terminalis]|nr:hypothetical protein FQR65_LT19396 [Abscondita terminalis]